MENVTLVYENLTVHAQEKDSLTKSEFVFTLIVRGVIHYMILLMSTFLNVSTIVVIYRNKSLQISSNALVISFSIGHSLAAIVGTLLWLPYYGLEPLTKLWKIHCTIFIFFVVSQQTINYISIMAISIERVYSIYYPLEAYKHNNFKKMMAFTRLVLFVSILHVVIEFLLGFYTENFTSTSCIGIVVMGQAGRMVLTISFVICSAISLLMSALVIIKLFKRRILATSSRPVNLGHTEYRISKMLVTGRFLNFAILLK